MKQLFLLLLLCSISLMFSCKGSKSSTQNKSATNTATNTAKNESGNKENTDLAKFVGDYTVQDECNGDFGYVVKIRPGLDNTLLITGLGTFPQTVTATLVDAMQFAIIDYNNTKEGQALTIRGVGNGMRDKATGTIALEYYISDSESIDTNCRASMVKQ